MLFGRAVPTSTGNGGASQIIRGFGNPLEPGRSTWRGTDGSAGASPYRSQSHLRSGSGVVVFRRHFGATESFNDCATRLRCEPGTDSLAKPQSSLCLAIPAGRESRPHIGSPFRLKATEVQTTKKLTCAPGTAGSEVDLAQPGELWPRLGCGKAHGH